MPEGVANNAVLTIAVGLLLLLILWERREHEFEVGLRRENVDDCSIAAVSRRRRFSAAHTRR